MKEFIVTFDDGKVYKGTIIEIAEQRGYAPSSMAHIIQKQLHCKVKFIGKRRLNMPCRIKFVVSTRPDGEGVIKFVGNRHEVMNFLQIKSNSTLDRACNQQSMLKKSGYYVSKL